MISHSLTQARQPVLTLPWLFSARGDIGFSLGGMLAGFAIVGMHQLLGWNMLVVWFVWVVMLDTPHFFATYSRTYLDRQARIEHRSLLRRSWLIFLLVPAVILMSAGLYKGEVPGFQIPWHVLLAAVGLWSYVHLTRQHYGFLRLYNRKNDEIGSFEARLDVVVLYGFMAASFLGVLTHFDRTRSMLGISPEIGSVLFDGALIAALGLASVFGGFQLAKLVRGESINFPKVLFLSTVLVLHGVVSFAGVLPPETMLALTATITIYHDIQYFVFVRFQGQRRYGRTEDSRRPFGFAGALSRNFLLFLAAGILLMSVPIWAFGCLIGRVPVCQFGPQWGDPTFLGETTWVLFFAALSMGAQMHHYVLDMYIWRPGKNDRLRRELNLESASGVVR